MIENDMNIIDNTANNNEESYVFPDEAACSPEFSEGCIIMDDERE